ncbi:MAG: glycosyltransferase [Candidatus Omnitrophica bacterium]|nr:glycosyltransferase [Candidatus Omnitrophota bacterium]
MNVAFYSYPSAFQNPGGGEVQLLKTKQAIEKLGVTVRLFDQWNDKLQDFDVIHIFGSVKDCVGLMQTAKNLKVKIAISSIFWSSFKRALHESKNPKKRLEFMARHAAKVLLPVFPSARRKTMMLADIVLPNSLAEARQLRRLFALPQEKISVVPNGVDERFSEASAESFKKKFKLENFILAVGRIEPRKNQLNLIKALRHLKQDLVIVGDPVSDYADYYRVCKKEAGANVHFLGAIDHEGELLASAYAACAVFVAPGWFETPGLAALEAGLAGAKLAVTACGCTREYFLSHAEYFDPARVSDIANAITQALKKPSSTTLKDHIMQHYTWDKVGQRTLEAYQRIIHA